MGRIPEGWKEYSVCGKPVKDVPIFAFKTPLAKKYSTQHTPDEEFVESENKFTPDDLVEFVAGLECEVAVVVDLTNTFRYYNGFDEFGRNHNIQYEKVKCEGQIVPNDGVMERVAEIVNDVIHTHGRSSKKVVGIHCTHGVNRTGYLIARYLVEWLGYEPDDAIVVVDEARGHKIEREAYLEDLRKRTPTNRFAEWEKHRKIAEAVNGKLDVVSLWTGFEDDDFRGPDGNMERKNRHHPYPRMFRGNQRHFSNYYCPRYPPIPNPYTERRFPGFKNGNNSMG